MHRCAVELIREHDVGEWHRGRVTDHVEHRLTGAGVVLEDAHREVAGRRFAAGSCWFVSAQADERIGLDAADGSNDVNQAFASGPRRFTTVTLSFAAPTADTGPRARRARLRMMKANLMNRCTFDMPPLRDTGSCPSPWDRRTEAAGRCGGWRAPSSGPWTDQLAEAPPVLSATVTRRSQVFLTATTSTTTTSGNRTFRASTTSAVTST